MFLSYTVVDPFTIRFSDSCFPWGHPHSYSPSLTLTNNVSQIQNNDSCKTGELENILDTRIKPYLTADNDWCDDKHPCDYYGQTYKWCAVKDGNWEYCCDGECSNNLCSTGKNHIERRCSPLVWKTKTGKLLEHTERWISLKVVPECLAKNKSVSVQINSWLGAIRQHSWTCSTMPYHMALLVHNMLSSWHTHNFKPDCPRFQPFWVSEAVWRHRSWYDGMIWPDSTITIPWHSSESILIQDTKVPISKIRLKIAFWNCIQIPRDQRVKYQG